MTKPNNQDKLWAKCPPGAIQRVADSAMVSRTAKPAVNLQRRNLLVGTATAAGVAVLGGATYLATREPERNGGSVTGATAPVANFNFGGINCIDVVFAVPEYVENTIDDQETIEKIEKHLELCDKCRMVYENQLKLKSTST